MKNENGIKISRFVVLGIILSVMTISAQGFISGSSTSKVSTASSQLIIDPNLVQFSKVHPGEIGILNFVVQNTGSLDAEDVEIWIPDTNVFSIGDKLKIGTIPGLSFRNLQTTVKVAKDANPGVYPVSIHLNYKKKKTGNYGSVDTENVDENWVIKLAVYGNPNFQLTAENTIFYKDIVSDFILNGYAENSAKSVSAELSSECLNVINSAKRYIGNIQKGDKFNLKYKIQPKSRPCAAQILIKYSDFSGNENTEIIPIGLQVNDNDIDFKIVDVQYGTLSPGQNAELNISLKNTGSFNVEDVSFSIDFKDPFSPIKTSEKYVDSFNKDEVKTISFQFSIKDDAETKGYTVPLNINYKISGVSYSTTKQIGLNVEGNILLIVTDVKTSGDKLEITIANIGTRTAESINLILRGNTTEQRGYIDKLAATKSRTRTFTIPKDENLKLILEYSDVNNERKTIQEDIKLPRAQKRSDEFPAAIVAVAVVAILAVVIFFFRKRF